MGQVAQPLANCPYLLNFNVNANELFEEHWNTKEMQKSFYDAYDTYFSGKHSDENYQEVVFNK